MAQAVDQAGNIWEVDAQGNPVRYVGKVGGIAPNPIKVQQAQTDIAKTQADTQGKALDNAITAQTLGPTVSKAVADAIKANGEGRITAKQDATNAGVIGTAERAKALQQFNGGRALGASISDIQQKFDAGPGATTGISGLFDYLPLPSNRAFDAAGTSVRGPVRNALGLTGSENNSPAEQRMNFQAYIPESANFDNVNRDIIERLRRVQNQAAIDAIQKLGGIPDANGNVVPLTPQQQQVFQAFSAAGGEVPKGYNGDIYSALLMGGGNPPAGPTGGAGGPSGPSGGPNGGGMPPAGPTLGLSRGENFTTPQDMAIAAAVQKAFQSGADINGLVQAAQSARGQITPQDLANFEQAIQARKAGQAVTFNPQATGRRTPFEAAAGNALMSPLGTAAATAISGTGFNALDGILPDQMKALRSLNPGSAAVGDVGGALLGTGISGALAKRIGTSLAPDLAAKVFANSRGANFARQLAGDTAYGASYGANVNGDAAGGALGGALGSAGGQLAGKVFGAGIGGLQRSQAGQYLAPRIPDMTIGQQMGGAFKSFEDAATSIPGIGDMINARRNASITGLNNAAVNEAAGIVGGQADNVDGLAPLRTNAYDTAVAGKSFPIDPQAMADLQAVQAQAAGLPADLRGKFDLAMKNRVGPVVNAPPMSGDAYQQAMRGLSGYKAEMTKPGFEADYRDALTGAQNALRGAVLRSASPETIGQLGNADRLYRAEKILQDAVGRNRKDAMGIGSDLFRPGDLTDAVAANARKYGGNVPFADLARYAQEAIPSKMADSGTARRLTQASLATAGLGGALGGGAGAFNSEDSAGGAVSGATDGAATGLGLLAILALGASKPGQKGLSEMLFNRPDSLTAFGRKVGQSKGLFGTATVPLLLQGGN